MIGYKVEWEGIACKHVQSIEYEGEWHHLQRASQFHACSMRGDGRWDWAFGDVSLLPWVLFPYLLLKNWNRPEGESRGSSAVSVWCHYHGYKTQIAKISKGDGKTARRTKKVKQYGEGDSCTLILETVLHFDRYTHYCFVFMPMEPLLLLLQVAWSQKSDYFRKVLLEL